MASNYFMGFCRRSSRMHFDGFRGYNYISRGRVRSFSSSPFVDGDGAKKFYNNKVYYEFMPRRGWKRWIWNLENAVAIALFGGGIAVIFSLGKWETVPYTKRRHFVALAASRDEKIGERKCEEMKKVLKEKVVPPLHPERVRVRRIAQDLIEAFRRQNVDDRSNICIQGWDLFLVDIPFNSIISYPGGKIVMFMEMLNTCGGEDDDAQIATLIAPEIGRSVARHAMEREAMLKLIPSILLLTLHIFYTPAIAYSMPSLLNHLRFPFARSVVYGIIWAGVSRLLKMYYSLKMDVEADYIGVLLVACAGYDPRVALQVREKIMERSFVNIGGHSFWSWSWEKIRTRLLALHMEEALSIYRERERERESDIHSSPIN